MQNNKKYIFLIIFYQNSIWYMIFIGVWITAVFQAALYNLETYLRLNVYTPSLTFWIT